MRAKSRSSSFLRKVFLSFLLIAIVATILLTLCLSVTYLSVTMETIDKFSDRLIRQSSYSIAYFDETVKRLSNMLLTDHNVIGYLNMKRHDSRIAIAASQAVDRQLVALSGFESVYLYNAQLNMLYSSKTGEQREPALFSDQRMAQWLTDPVQVQQYAGGPIAFDDADSPSVSICSYPMFEPGEYPGGLRNAIVINVETSLLTRALQLINSRQDASATTFMILNGNGAILGAAYGEELGRADPHIPLLVEQINALPGSGRDFIQVEGTHYMVNYSRDNANAWCIVGVTPVEAAFGDIATASLFAMGVVILIFTLVVLICFMLAKRIHSPIKAIRQAISGDMKQKPAPSLKNTDEFRYILSVFESMREQNEQLDRMARENSRSEKQNLLVSLLSGSVQANTEDAQQRLADLHLHDLQQQPLCMCLFKLDRYSQIKSQNSKKERWALRYAIVDIITEIAQEQWRFEVFNCAPDQFVLLLKCDCPYKVFLGRLDDLLRDISEGVSKCLHVTLSCAYSTLFTGLEHLPSMYETMKSSILLKLRYGHGCVISPYVLDEINADNFCLTMKQEGQFVERATAGEKAAAMAIFKEISANLYRYAYNEILSCVLHLAYSVYLALLERHPALRGSQDFPLKGFMSDLQTVEVASDIDLLMEQYLTAVCGAVNRNRELSSTRNCSLIVTRALDIIEREYPDPGLCLSSIAEQLRLSPNYLGHLFKTAQGKSIAQYILELRMNKLAEYMQSSSLSINAILEKVGLEKNNYFYTRFKKHFGVSLGEYRVKLGKEEEG